MGTYATTTSIDTLDSGWSLDTATTSLASKGIDWGETFINSKLSRRFDVSSFATSVPPQITSIAEMFGLAFLHRNNSRGGKESLLRAKELEDIANSMLDDIANYKVDLVDSSGSLIAEKSSQDLVKSNTSDYSNTFNEDDPLKWTPDSDKLSDIADERSS